MVGNFGKRLKPYDMTVKELTGDMNLSRAEIEDAQARSSCMTAHGSRLQLPQHTHLTLLQPPNWQ
jgi:hypothetical protein